jgi:DNA-binding CsgD family transcriptional regulator
MEATRPRTGELRAQFREAERQASRLRLLQDACHAIAADENPRLALRAALAHAARFLAADAALALRLDAGGLTVQASHGPALPPGARVAVIGPLRTALQQPLQVREAVVSRLRVTGGGAAALEVLVPLRLHGEVAGLLALSSARPVARPDGADADALQALAVVLAAALDSRAGAVATAAAGTRPPRAPRRDPNANAMLALLTPREQQVLALLPRGPSNAEIGAQLGIATGTAKVHIERILHKLGLKTRAQAAVRAAEWGIGK